MWTRKDYEREAQNIAKAFSATKGEQSINKLAAESARINNLNPEGIRTLVRLANVDAFNEEFSKMSGDDRILDFTTGDPEQVIAELQNDAETKVASIQRVLSGSPEYDQAVDYEIDPVLQLAPMEKAAEAEPEEPKIPRHEAILLLKRAAEEFGGKVRQGEMAWIDLMEKAAQSIRVLGDIREADKLEKDALAVVGTTVVPELHMLAKMTGREYTLTTEKVASVLDKHLAVPSRSHRPIITMLEKASMTRAKRNENKKCLEFVREKLSAVE